MKTPLEHKRGKMPVTAYLRDFWLSEIHWGLYCLFFITFHFYLHVRKTSKWKAYLGQAVERERSRFHELNLATELRERWSSRKKREDQGREDRGKMKPHVGYGVIKFSPLMSGRHEKICVNELAKW